MCSAVRLRMWRTHALVPVAPGVTLARAALSLAAGAGAGTGAAAFAAGAAAGPCPRNRQYVGAVMRPPTQSR